jgi:hypothetical protein
LGLLLNRSETARMTTNGNRKAILSALPFVSSGAGNEWGEISNILCRR